MKPPAPERRQPTLADRFIAARYPAHERYLPPSTLSALQGAARNAHKFVLDDNATRRIAHVVRDIPDLIVREHAFARAPFDLTWIEFPHWLYWRELGNDPAGQDKSADHTIGYLIEGNAVTVIGGGTVGEPTMMPYPGVLQFHLNTEWGESRIDTFMALGDIGALDTIDRYLWGSTYTRLDAETRTLLRQRNRIAMFRGGVLEGQKAATMRRRLQATMSGGAGELRTIIAILLMLNRPTITRYGTQPAGRGWLRGKNIPYMAHTTVTIDVDAVPTLRLLGTPAGDGVPRRRHEVRGHYCHDATARDYMRIAGCQHAWAPHNDEWTPWPSAPETAVNHWVCRQCGGKRWWRTEHERGDAGRGFVTHEDYSVTAGAPHR